MKPTHQYFPPSEFCTMDLYTHKTQLKLTNASMLVRGGVHTYVVIFYLVTGLQETMRMAIPRGRFSKYMLTRYFLHLKSNIIKRC